MIGYFSTAGKMSQFNPDQIILKVGLLGSCSLAPKTKAKEVAMGKRRRGGREKERKSVNSEKREERRKRREEGGGEEKGGGGNASALNV